MTAAAAREAVVLRVTPKTVIVSVRVRFTVIRIPRSATVLPVPQVQRLSTKDASLRRPVTVILSKKTGELVMVQLMLILSHLLQTTI